MTWTDQERSLFANAHPSGERSLGVEEIAILAEEMHAERKRHSRGRGICGLLLFLSIS